MRGSALLMPSTSASAINFSRSEFVGKIKVCFGLVGSCSSNQQPKLEKTSANCRSLFANCQTGSLARNVYPGSNEPSRPAAPQDQSGYFTGRSSLSVRKSLCVVRGLHLACATVFAHIAGFGESVVPLGRLGSWCGGVGPGSDPVEHLWESASLRCPRRFADQCFHKY